MSWQTKVWFFLSGYVACFAVFAAMMDKPICLGAWAVAALYWVLGDKSRDNKDD